MINKYFAILTEIENSSARFRSKAGELADKLLSLAEIFILLSGDERKIVRDSISPDVGMKLLTIGTFAAENAMNDHNEVWLKAALISHIMEDIQTDYRENLRRLVLIDYAAKKIGANLEEIFNEVKVVASGKCRDFLESFFARDPNLNHLKSVGMKESKEDGIIKFAKLP